MPGCDGAEKAERSYPVSEARGVDWEELPHVRGQGQPGGATVHPRSEVVASSNPIFKEWWLRGYRKA